MSEEPIDVDVPDDAFASTVQRIETGYGKVYVNIGYDAEGNIVRVIANTGNSGGIRKATTEAIYKTITCALEAGADPRVVAESLVDIREPKTGSDNGDYIYSVADAIAVAMLRFIEGSISEPVKDGGMYDE